MTKGLRDWFLWDKTQDNVVSFLLRVTFGGLFLLGFILILALTFYGGLKALGYGTHLLCDDEVYQCDEHFSVPLALADLVFIPIGMFIVGRAIYKWFAPRSKADEIRRLHMAQADHEIWKERQGFKQD
jgi:hypothetical protein